MNHQTFLWNKAPFIRLLSALIVGIVVQWQIQFSLVILASSFTFWLSLLLIYSFVGIRYKFQVQALSGISLLMLLASTGALFVWKKDIRHDKNWFGEIYKARDALLITIEEPLVEKTNSYKALATINGVYQKGQLQATQGKVILYFKKDSAAPALHYGDVVITANELQEIRNSGNPGSFDYKRYCLFQGITHQAYLTSKDYRLTGLQNKDGFTNFIYNCRQWVVRALRTFIKGDKEQGLAEALLIGYKDDLDKNLVQSYTNTGVVHVIAISGLHLGLIYWLLLFVTKPLQKRKHGKLLALLLVIGGLWMFGLLAGAQPSVLRSAVMFTVIAIGVFLSKRASIYNTLALSAFLLLCINPFWLWDVGFQLSYTAVLSIVLFFRPVYNWFYFENKSLDFVWKMNAVTLSAQILTVPLSIYHFHQFPSLFLFTNLVAVPLSSLILIGEILLCAFALLPVVANWIGSVLRLMIYGMNTYIERLDNVSFAVWNGLSINLVQFFLLTAFALAFCYWLLEKRKTLFWISAVCLLLFISARSTSFIYAQQQQQLIVYNVPKHQAIDVINGRHCSFIGDDELMHDAFIRNFHIQPSRISHRIEQIDTSFERIKSFTWQQKHFLIVDAPLPSYVASTKQSLDVIILSRNPRLYMNQLLKHFNCKQIVIDGSVPAWKAALWKKDCDSLKIPYHDVAQKGAFVMTL